MCTPLEITVDEAERGAKDRRNGFAAMKHCKDCGVIVYSWIGIDGEISTEVININTCPILHPNNPE